MSNFCATCGAKLQDSWHHCINCGTKVNKEPEVIHESAIPEATNVLVQEETNLPIPINPSTGDKSQKTTIFIVITIMLIALVVFFGLKGNSNNTFVPSSDSQSLDTTNTPQPSQNDTVDSSDILGRLNNNDFNVKWIEDSFGVPALDVAKYIEATYVTDECGVWVVTDEHSTDSFFSSWVEKNYWTIKDKISGKFIVVTSDRASNSADRTCVIQAGFTFGYNLTN
jgi:hypothetical protein